ncbi:ATP-binding protein [Sandarakinorhabdus sp.]|uniref:HAMP domain-containing sensor histidine kinase n=1 Tax=Sandarakinorhabdus sp. TaxID=1916663 RepID=UPI00286E7643|nr:ATP-binding protein [Sandarakinorhabdus sp.]
MLLSSSTLLIFLERLTEIQLDNDNRSRIAEIYRATDAAWRRGGPAAGLVIVNGELQVPGPLVIHVERADGSRLAGNLGDWPIGLATDRLPRRLMLASRREPLVKPFVFIGAILPDGHRIAVGRSLEAESRLQETLLASLMAALALALTLSWISSRWIVGIISNRARIIAEVAGEVTAGDLSRRVPVQAGPAGDAFDSMSMAFNVMLARIEGLLDELRAVTDGLAHDLRSPLTRLKARIDRLGMGSAVNAADLQAVSVEAEGLLAMLDNSLEISRAEAGIGRDSFASLDLVAMVSDLVEMYEPLADDAGVRMVMLTAQPVTAMAHRQLLGRALANLIDNALRYGAAGGVIELGVERTACGARLTVADHGPGIPAASRDDALRRFGRLDAARPTGQRGQGAGLGLSLAAAVARLHGGSLSLADNKPGLLVSVAIPTQA